jgi:hypothetical protein
METDPFSERLYSLVCRIPADGQIPETQYFSVLYTIIRILQILQTDVWKGELGLWDGIHDIHACNFM